MPINHLKIEIKAIQVQEAPEESRCSGQGGLADRVAASTDNKEKQKEIEQTNKVAASIIRLRLVEISFLELSENLKPRSDYGLGKSLSLPQRPVKLDPSYVPNLAPWWPEGSNSLARSIFKNVTSPFWSSS